MSGKYDNDFEVKDDIDKLSDRVLCDEFINSLDAILIKIVNKFESEDSIIKDMSDLMDTIGIDLNIYDMQRLVDHIRNFNIKRYAYVGSICRTKGFSNRIDKLIINWIIDSRDEEDKLFTTAITFKHNGTLEVFTSLKKPELNMIIDLHKPKEKEDENSIEERS